jgi:septum site-determining protein MinD
VNDISTITILSGKGGVGKTTTAVNLAHALTTLGKNVLIVEANLTAPNLHLHLGGTDFPATFNDVLQGKAEAMHSIYRHASGINILPGSSRIADLGDLDLSKGPEIIHELEHQFDTIIIDGAAGLGREAHFAFELADEVLLVTTPDLPSASGCVRVLAIAKALRKTPLGLVLTQVRDDHYEMRDEALHELSDIPIIARIPYRREIRESQMRKHPVTHLFPKTKAAKAYIDLAKTLGTKNAFDIESNMWYSLLRNVGIRVNR